jgi:hypothetical protein
MCCIEMIEKVAPFYVFHRVLLTNEGLVQIYTNPVDNYVH